MSLRLSEIGSSQDFGDEFQFEEDSGALNSILNNKGMVTCNYLINFKTNINSLQASVAPKCSFLRRQIKSASPRPKWFQIPSENARTDSSSSRTREVRCSSEERSFPALRKRNFSPPLRSRAVATSEDWVISPPTCSHRGCQCLLRNGLRSESLQFRGSDLM